jgi:hypothetical protein
MALRLALFFDLLCPSCTYVCDYISYLHLFDARDSLYVQSPVVPHEAKEPAIAYISNNCSVNSGRNDIMRAVMALAAKSTAGASKLQVHSLGKCENNRAWPGQQTAQQVISRQGLCRMLCCNVYERIAVQQRQVDAPLRTDKGCTDLIRVLNFIFRICSIALLPVVVCASVAHTYAVHCSNSAHVLNC